MVRENSYSLMTNSNVISFNSLPTVASDNYLVSLLIWCMAYTKVENWLNG